MDLMLGGPLHNCVCEKLPGFNVSRSRLAVPLKRLKRALQGLEKSVRQRMAGRGACRTDGMKAFKGGKNMKNDGQIWTTGDLTNDVHGESTKKKQCGLRWFNNGH